MIKIHECAFNQVLGDINLVPVLGQKFADYFPFFILVLFAFNYFDVYAKMLKCFGLNAYQFSEDYEFKTIENGRNLVLKARLEEERKLKACFLIEMPH